MSGRCTSTITHVRHLFALACVACLAVCGAWKARDEREKEEESPDKQVCPSFLMLCATQTWEEMRDNPQSTRLTSILFSLEPPTSHARMLLLSSQFFFWLLIGFFYSLPMFFIHLSFALMQPTYGIKKERNRERELVLEIVLSYTSGAPLVNLVR